MELRHLRYFAAVAETQHVGRAAQQLRVAQAALSRQVADLERELGVALFVRHPRGMALTAAGREFLAHAREILARSAQAVEHVRRLGGAATLRVGVLDFGAGAAVLLRAVAAFRAAYPHAGLAFAPAPHLGHAADVAAGRLDVGFHVGLSPDAAGLAAECVAEERLAGALLAAAHPLARRAALDPADLARLPYVGFPPEGMAREYEDEFARLGAAGWRGRVDHPEPSVAVMVARLAAGDAWVHSVPWGATVVPPAVAYRPLLGGTGTPYHAWAVTRAGEAADGGDPLAAAFLACLRAARDELAAPAPAA